MIEKILLLTLTVLFLTAFFTRNLIVKKRTGQPIRTRDRLVVSSIVLSALCFFVTIFSTYDQWYHFMGAIYFLRTPLISYAGIVLFGISIILAGTISAQLKDSWRVGVHEDQKTTLMKDGVYAYARNPYFISYYIMYFSLFLIRPSIILMVLVLATVALFHRMVLNPDCAVDIYCGLKILVATLVSLRFSAPRYGAYCTIWVKRRNPFIFYAWERIRKI